MDESLGLILLLLLLLPFRSAEDKLLMKRAHLVKKVLVPLVM